jgi:hypothetical protein
MPAAAGWAAVPLGGRRVGLCCALAQWAAQLLALLRIPGNCHLPTHHCTTAPQLHGAPGWLSPV